MRALDGSMPQAWWPNAARIALAEREREVATLRVFGFTLGETWRVVAGTSAVQLALALPLGWGAGWAFTWITARATASDLMRIPASSPRRTARGPRSSSWRPRARCARDAAVARPPRPRGGPESEGATWAC